MSKKIDRTGETKENKYGSKMTIVEYNNNSDITVEFENNYRVHSSYTRFKNGNIQSVYDKNVFEVGYIGEGDYKTNINDKITIQYQYWYNMLQRCYSEKYHTKQPTYIGCEVCEEWHCYQTFAKWFDENYYECDGDKMCLDKDILDKNNKVYSPNTCIFVPNRINMLFVKRDSQRGQYPIGVTYMNNKFISRCSILEGKKYLGSLNTPEEAFEKYKVFKEQYIKEVAEKYKIIIPIKLYEAMYKWQVEMDD